MENKNIFIGKLQKNGCYVNNGKYGYFLTCDKKNYKIPEWFPAESMTLEIAERLIEYKNKMSEQYLVTKDAAKEAAKEGIQVEEESKGPVVSEGEESTEEERKTMVLTKTKK